MQDVNAVDVYNDQIVDIRRELMDTVNEHNAPHFSLATTMVANKLMSEMQTPSMKTECPTDF